MSSEQDEITRQEYRQILDDKIVKWSPRVSQGSHPSQSTRDKLPLTQEAYTAELYELMGQFAGVMATVESPDDLRDQYAVMRDIQQRLIQLYARKRASWPVER